MTKSELIATFPETFGLRAFPGQEFKINSSASYESPLGSGEFMLYTFTVPEGEAFCKGSPRELRRALVEA